MKKIVFTGGGTLGHVMPNIFLAEELKDWECHYIGSSGIEKQKIQSDKRFVYHEIVSTKLVRGKFFSNLKIPFVLIKAIIQAKKILKQIKPDIIFSKGGYVALPVCIAGRMLKIPIIAHESDYSFGLANKIILKTCKVMCVNFKNLEKKNKKCIYTGPIFGREFEKKKADTSKFTLDEKKKTMLVVGGSLGSVAINNALFPIVGDLLKRINIIHITGKNNNKLKSHDNYNALEISDDIVNLYNMADFVLGRSGAGVTAECFFKHIPMLLIPLENGASRGDQLQNANYYVNFGVAEVLKESDLTPTTLEKSILKFLDNLKERKNAYEKAKQINGREKIVDLINKFSIK